jgi:hypothetical protein
MNDLSEDERIAGIHSLNPTNEKKLVRYDGVEKLYNVYEIPLEFLVYNPYNGRIRSLTLSYEAQYNRKLDAQNDKDRSVIEQFLFDSAKAKNEKTIESIEAIGQQEFGIVTYDGVIIDGNRRAMILNDINRRTGQDRKFKAVILNDKLIGKEKEIITLETSYQMGVDSKVDYNPIEKYIRCKELRRFYSNEEIGAQMSEAPKQIQEWLDILTLMEDYLNFLNTPEMYIRLEKREGHFVDLYKYINAYIGRGSHQSVDWRFNDSDVLQMKKIYFTYIRLGIPVARARVIARPASKNSFFCHEDIWKDFVKDHSKAMADAVELSFIELKVANEGESNITLVNFIDKQWRASVEIGLEEDLFYHESILGDKLNTQAPLKLLKKTKSTLYQIDIEILKEELDEETIKLIEDIQAVLATFKALY